MRTFSSKFTASTDLRWRRGVGGGGGAAAAASRSAAVEKKPQTESRGSCCYHSYS